MTAPRIVGWYPVGRGEGVWWVEVGGDPPSPPNGSQREALGQRVHWRKKPKGGIECRAKEIGLRAS